MYIATCDEKERKNLKYASLDVGRFDKVHISNLNLTFV